jgi:hypothetical protein
MALIRGNGEERASRESPTFRTGREEGDNVREGGGARPEGISHITSLCEGKEGSELDSSRLSDRTGKRGG